jgi:mono/diheme cytochrome c family protein
MLGRVVTGVGAAGLLGLAAFLVLAWRPAIAPIDRPAAANLPAGSIAQGEILAGAGYCAVCHTRPGGPPFAGGYGLRTPFGMVYSTNITPEPDTGIGAWSLEAFTRAMHDGVSRDGSHLFPAFPYDHFTRVSDDDVKALYGARVRHLPIRADAVLRAINIRT